MFLVLCLVGLAIILSIDRWMVRNELSTIPTIGPSGLLSYIQAVRYIWDARAIVQEGYDKYYGKAFKVPLLDRWLIYVSGAKLTEEIRKAPDDVLSSIDANAYTLQLEYTLGRCIWTNPYHEDIIRTQVTRYIGVRLQDIRDEIVAAFNDFIPVRDDEWTRVLAYETILKLTCRSSGRYFVGPLCRDPEYIALSSQFTIDVFQGANIINLFPPLLHPVIGPLMSTISKRLQVGKRLLCPTIEYRLAMLAKYGRDWPDKPNDLLSWLIDAANEEERNVCSLTRRIMTVNIATIHTTSTAFAFALYALAGQPELAEPLRKEVESIVAIEGWSKVALSKMHHLDSFLKETSRIFSNTTGVTRRARKPFVFSDGTRIPPGHFVTVAMNATHHDEANYPSPNEFLYDRFLKVQEGPEESHCHQMTSPGKDYLFFGIGRHACPGRFFAVAELKMLLAHVLAAYDVRFEHGTVVPAATWFSSLVVPDQQAAVMFRARRR